MGTIVPFSDRSLMLVQQGKRSAVYTCVWTQVCFLDSPAAWLALVTQIYVSCSHRPEAPQSTRTQCCSSRRVYLVHLRYSVSPRILGPSADCIANGGWCLLVWSFGVGRLGRRGLGGGWRRVCVFRSGFFVPCWDMFGAFVRHRWPRLSGQEAGGSVDVSRGRVCSQERKQLVH